MRCPDCGSSREVSLEHAIRISKGIHSSRCVLCKHPPKIEVTEEHRLFWLERAGVSGVTGPTGTAHYIRTNGIPESLKPIVASAAFLPW